ncbi:MAG: hypothetical protein ACTSRZ_02380 [Promethearchaeota archaeon]
MSKEKLIAALESAWDNGKPFIDYTKDYVYALIPVGDGNWKEFSYDRQSGELEERTINGATAFRMLIEEIEKGLALELEEFMLNDFRDFRNSLGGADEEKIVKVIEELYNNSEKYSKDFPIIKNKGDLPNLTSSL